MYYHPSIAYQFAQEKQRDMMAAADHDRRVRQAREAAAPRAPRSRGSRRTWHLVRPLRPQAQS